MSGVMKLNQILNFKMEYCDKCKGIINSKEIMIEVSEGELTYKGYAHLRNKFRRKKYHKRCFEKFKLF